MAESPKPNQDKDLRVEATDVGPLLATDTCRTDADLATVVNAWDRLPEAIRAGIVAMVKAAAPGDRGR